MHYPDVNKLPAGLRFIFSRATKLAKDDRYQSVTDLLSVLRRHRDVTDPKKNIRVAFDTVKANVDRLNRVKHYDADLLAQLMDLAGEFLERDFASGLTLFDSIDNEILRKAAILSEEAINRVLAKFVDAMELRANNGNYSRDCGYADEVAKKARLLWKDDGSCHISDAGSRETCLGCSRKIENWRSWHAEVLIHSRHGRHRATQTGRARRTNRRGSLDRRHRDAATTIAIGPATHRRTRKESGRLRYDQSR